MKTCFWLVRHGPTHAKAAIGWTDIPADLSDTRQIAALSNALPCDAIMVSSDLQRTIETGDAIKTGQQRLPHDPKLRELNFGDWDGRDFADIETADPHLSCEFWENPGNTAPPNGESWNDLTARVQDRLLSLATDYPNQDVVAVVHFGVILSAIGFARCIPAHALMGFQIDPLSLTKMTYLHGANAWRVECVNQRF